jgi:peptidoglycan/LPS O-acetylase OafA/YrhL
VVYFTTMLPTESGSKSLFFIDNARGLAALSVALFHYFGTLNNQYLDGTIIEKVAVYLENGVSVFFIVSGFIIPYTLLSKGYQLKNYPHFLLKRILRLDPPYWISTFLVIAITWFLANRAGQGFPYSTPQLVAHIAYINAFVGFPWVNVVFWTLAVEFQYYVILGLIFPLMTRYNTARIGIIATLFVLPAVFQLYRDNITTQAPYFGFGILACFYFCNKIKTIECYCWVIYLVCLTVFGVLPWHYALVMCITALLFFMLNFQHKILRFLSLISYSLYLVHNYSGMFLIAFVRKRTDSFLVEIIVGLLAIVVALGAAYVFYLLIEKPSKRWSKSIKFTSGLDKSKF